MSGIADTIEAILAAARQVTSAIPGLSGISPLIGVGEKLVDIIDDLVSSAPDDRTQAQMQTDRAALAAAVSAKAESLANRLDG